MEWYRSLNGLQKIILKEECVGICGVPYNMLIRLFGMRGTIELLYEKLKLEGFNI